MSIRIYRRQFADPGAPEDSERKRDKEIRVLKTREVVAVFPEKCLEEAGQILSFLQKITTQFKAENVLQAYRYTMEIDPPEIKRVEEVAGLQIDTSKATKTSRPIKFTFSWERLTIDGKDFCKCLAWHERYGAVRGEIPNNVQGRLKFLLCVRKVWPNAIQLEQDK